MRDPRPVLDPAKLAYLRVLEIPVWVRREAAPVIGAEAPEPAEPASPGSPPPPGATDLDALRARVERCTACDLAAGRNRTVFGVGDPRAACMVIGEGPGADEDRQGEPFVGRAGRLLNQMLGAIGLDRESVYIANIVKCRPPRNRDPRPEEVASCGGYLRRQIELVRPRVIVTVGRVASQNLLGTAESMGRLRGREHRHPGTDTPVIATYHPAYLLRSPGEKRKAWDDLKRVRRMLAAAEAAR